MTEHAPHGEEAVNPDVQFEHTDAGFWGVVAFGISLALSIVVIQIILWFLFRHWDVQQRRVQQSLYGPATELAGQRPAEPQLEGLKPLQDTRQWREPAERQAAGYGWVDKGKGIAYIPIDQAIDLTAAALPIQHPPKATKEGKR